MSFPIIRIGFGKVFVGSAQLNDKRALVFADVGDGNEQITPDDLLAAVTFEKPEDVDVVIAHLFTIRNIVEKGNE